MGLFGRKRGLAASDAGLSRDAALAMAPVRSVQAREERSPAGALVLSCPTTLKPWLAGVARRLGLKPEMSRRRVELDEMGETVWSLVDGRRSAEEIAALFAERYGLRGKEARLSVALFLRQLGGRGLIGFR